jgi:hypothetical protein
MQIVDSLEKGNGHAFIFWFDGTLKSLAHVHDRQEASEPKIYILLLEDIYSSSDRDNLLLPQLLASLEEWRIPSIGWQAGNVPDWFINMKDWKYWMMTSGDEGILQEDWLPPK